MLFRLHCQKRWRLDTSGDFAEDTKDGKRTTCAINVVAFQRNLKRELRTLLSFEFCYPSQSKKLKDNTFNDLQYFNPPSKGAFQRPPGFQSLSPTDIENVKKW